MQTGVFDTKEKRTLHAD